MPARRTKLLPAAQAAAFNSFKVDKISGSDSLRRRSKFGPKRRQEVKAVRRKRACLRCALLHISCSHHDICSPCQQLALISHVYEKQTLSFSGCVRTMLSEVSIFAPSIWWPHGTKDDLSAKSQKLAMAEITLDFSISWDLSHLVENIIHWLNNPILSEISTVGTLSSPQFIDLIKPSIDELARTDFHRMIYAISLAYTQPDSHHFTIPELYQVGAIAGHRFLERLDKLLKPQHLKTCSGDELRVLYLLVVGTILAVGYTNLNISSKDSKNCAEFKDMRSFLCQILAHYVIYLGSQLKLPMASGADQFILEAASKRWHKQGAFQWRTITDHITFTESVLVWECASRDQCADLPQDLDHVEPPSSNIKAAFSGNTPSLSVRPTTETAKVIANERHYCTHMGCSRYYQRVRDLVRHTRSHHSNSFFPCPYAGCSYRGNRRDNLAQHVRAAHANGSAAEELLLV